MNIIINGQPHSLGPHTNVDHLIESLDLQGKRLAVEVNREIVPRSQYREHILREADEVEIVRAIGGG